LVSPDDTAQNPYESKPYQASNTMQLLAAGESSPPMDLANNQGVWITAYHLFQQKIAGKKDAV